jgi:hypothetical protein
LKSTAFRQRGARGFDHALLRRVGFAARDEGQRRGDVGVAGDEGRFAADVRRRDDADGAGFLRDDGGNLFGDGDLVGAVRDAPALERPILAEWARGTPGIRRNFAATEAPQPAAGGKVRVGGCGGARKQGATESEVSFAPASPPLRKLRIGVVRTCTREIDGSLPRKKPSGTWTRFARSFP